MARSKTPAKRTASETQKHANGALHQLDDAVHSIEKSIEEQAELLARNPVEQKEAGLVQLVICIGGIYASL
jgi:UDP-galactose transporter B1